MAICPKCENKLTVPAKKLENNFFTIEGYTCDRCGTNFKVSN
jgi:hypothetical protein